MKIIAATHNKHKIEEMRAILAGAGVELLSPADAGYEIPEIEEYGESFEENSLIKAKEVLSITGMVSIADDSGLEVAALGGAPGIYSARYAALGTEDEDREVSDSENNAKLLCEMRGMEGEDRRARYVCIVTIAFPNGLILNTRGECSGTILLKPEGSGGFGYDPIFRPDGFETSFGLIDSETKNKMSHRAEALRLMCELLSKNAYSVG